jgi:Tripartite tricarboxylate transporter TctB family
MTHRKLLLGLGSFFMIFGVLAMWQSAKLSFFSFGIPGPGFFPFGTAALVALAGLGVCFVKPEEGEEIRWSSAAGSIAAVIGYFLIFERLGVMTATLIYALASLVLVSGLPFRTALITGVTSVLILWGGFELAIGTPFLHGLVW